MAVFCGRKEKEGSPQKQFPVSRHQILESATENWKLETGNRFCGESPDLNWANVSVS
jgi:hypothetical protein